MFHLDNLIESATSKEPSERPTMQEFAQELRAWLTLAGGSISETDVSDLANRIKSQSKPFFETQSRMGRSVEAATAITQRLMSDLQGVFEELKKTGLPCNQPDNNANNLVKGSDLEPSKYGAHGTTVSMYTPSPRTHIYECGIVVQVLENGRHRLYAAHRIRPHEGEIETIWSESHEAEFGSSQEETLLNQLVEGVFINLRPGLQRFLDLMNQNP